MADDLELKALRDQVRSLEAQLAIRSGGGPRGDVPGPGGAPVLIGVAIALVVAGAGAFFAMSAGRHRDEGAEAAAAAAQAAEAQAACSAELAATRAQLAATQAEEEQVEAEAEAGAFVNDDAVYEGQVSATTGASHVHVGDTCRIDVEWTTDPSQNCRALVDCGERRMYGDVSQGWFGCRATADQGLVHGQDVQPTTHDGDPRIDIDRTSGVVTMSDDDPAWSVTLAIPIIPDSSALGLRGS